MRLLQVDRVGWIRARDSQAKATTLLLPDRRRDLPVPEVTGDGDGSVCRRGAQRDSPVVSPALCLPVSSEPGHHAGVS